MIPDTQNPDTQITDAPITERVRLVPFDRLGVCRLVRPVGSGATGAVYLAELEQDRPYGARGMAVAIKILHPALRADADVYRRFAREARIGSALSHPGIVTTYEARLDDVDAPHLILEYIDGRDLRALVRELVRVPEAMLRELGATIARGLAPIHAAGALHRDLKPTNLLMTRDHQIKIADFGAVHLMAPDTLSATHGFLGTPLYASPEQLAGRPLGPASDLYALGVILYEAATGVQPFAAADIQGIIARQHEFVPRRAGDVHPHLTDLFQDLLEALLDKDPTRRPASAIEVAEVLERGEQSAWWRERSDRVRVATARTTLSQIHVDRSSPVVGRTSDLERLQAWQREALAGDGRMVVIEGEAGVGKSRLVAELVAGIVRDGADVAVLYGSNPPASPSGGPGAITQAVVGHFGRSHLVGNLRPHLAAVPTLVPAFAAHLLGQPEAPSSTGFDAPARHAAYGHLVSSLAATRPVVWIVDDLHFARAEDRALLGTLARTAAASAVLIVATTRPDSAVEDLAALRRLPHTRVLRLERLPADAVVDLVRSCAGETLAERWGATVAHRSDGNPLFALAMVRELAEQGHAITADLATADLGTVPFSVRDLLTLRLASLDAAERTLLDVAAVLGFAFAPDLVAAVLERPRLAILQSLASMERRTALIHGTATGFEFDHHLLQEWLYSQLPPLLRAEYHGLLAHAYRVRDQAGDQAASPTSGPAATFLAGHYLRGDRPQDGLRYVVAALRHLHERFDNEQALDLAHRALVHRATAGPELVCDIHLIQARVLTHVGRASEGLELATQAARIATTVGDAGRLAESELAIGTLSCTVSDLDGARTALSSALAAARIRGDRSTEAHCARKLGLVFVAMAEFDAAGAQFDAAIAITREIGQKGPQAEALRSRARIPLLTGRYAEAQPLLEASLTICRDIGDRLGEVNTLGALGFMNSRRGRERAALECFRRQRELARSIGYRSGEAHADTNIASASIHLGEYPEAEVCIQRSLRLAGSMGDRLMEATSLHDLGTLELHQGNLAAARTAFSASLGRLQAIGERRFEPDALIDLAVVDAIEGNLEMATSSLRQALTMARDRRLAAEIARATYELGNVAFAQDQLEPAASLYREATAAASALGDGSNQAVALAALARVRFQQGDSEALELFERSRTEASVDSPSSLGQLPEAYLTALDGRRFQQPVEPRARLDVRAETHLVLHRAGVEPEGQRRAAELLDHLARHFSGKQRQRFRRHNPVARMSRQS